VFSLATTLYLLAWDPEAGELSATPALPFLVRAGALTDLVQRDMLTDRHGRAAAAPDMRTGDPVLDQLLDTVAASRPHTWQAWVWYRVRPTEAAVRRQLVAHGYLGVRQRRFRRFLGAYRGQEYALAAAGAVAGLRTDAVGLLRGGIPPAELSARDAALVALAAAGRLRTIVTAADAIVYQGRIAELAKRGGRGMPESETALTEIRLGLAAAVGSTVMPLTADEAAG
jgi:hypothetical protein